MPFNRVVILGGGPIGLLCAIEAKKYFPYVFIIEKRSGYTRGNVPVPSNDFAKHLWDIGVGQEFWPSRQQAGSTSLSFEILEKALLRKAEANGIEMVRSYVVSTLIGDRQMPNAHANRSLSYE